jgi:site-specific DNA-methyltransferase (cytosine-N4-specific)
MQRLLKSGKYNSGRRPSQHVIGSTSFLISNKGAIPPNVIIASNTQSKSGYLSFCRKNNIIPHPARMPEEIPLFFIRFLTKKKDLVLDPFAGSNVTGAVAEKLDRGWLAIETNRDFARGSKGRFVTL